jgi:hypothetical protein
MNDNTEMKRAIKKIIGKAYKSCVKAERKAAKAILKRAGQRTAEWNKRNVTVSKRYNTIQRNELCPCESGLKYKKCCQLVIHNREQAVYEDIYAQRRLKDVIDAAGDNTDIDVPSLILPDRLQDKEIKIIIP